MTEAFLVLLAGGVMLAAFISDPREVTVNWLRLAGIVALAMSGLAIVFGLQAVINMGVNVSLLPAKGMTLPFISSGGSSLIGMAFAMGLVLSLARRRTAHESADLGWRFMPA